MRDRRFPRRAGARPALVFGFAAWLLPLAPIGCGGSESAIDVDAASAKVSDSEKSLVSSPPGAVDLPVPKTSSSQSTPKVGGPSGPKSKSP
jgi:hypothetical protein